MKQELLQALLSGLGTILIGVIGYLSRYVANYLKDKEIMQELKNKYYIVEMAVNAVEQIYHHENGPQKFDRAKKEIIKLAKTNDVEITDDEIDMFIEEVVYAMNKGFKEELPKKVGE